MRARDWIQEQVRQNDQRVSKLNRMVSDLGVQLDKINEEVKGLEVENARHKKDMEKL